MTPFAAMSLPQALVYYEAVARDRNHEHMRVLCRHDLFYLLTVACRRRDLIHPWIYTRVREFEADPDGHLDLWARAHGKSSIITFGGTVQEILRDPEVTVGIFSHTRPIAKSFLSQIKSEFEDNEFLKALFPEILYANPKREAPKWSLDGGITVKRKGNPKEQTVEAHGLVDGQPTGMHYTLMVYDDVVTLESVTSTEMIMKTTDAWATSLNLASRPVRIRYIGTRYHAADTYRTMMDRGAASPRIYAATDDATMEGKAVFLSDKELRSKRAEMGPYVYACQMLLNPFLDTAQGFDRDWLEFYDGNVKTGAMNIYITVDPASEKKKLSDYTTISAIGLAPDQNYYLLDLVRDRLNLTERGRALFTMVQKFPNVIRVGYEKYGLQADIEFVRYLQDQYNYRFPIIPLGGQMPKPDRIKRLVPLFEQHRFWLPRRLLYVDWEKQAHDLIADFLRDEYEAFPVATHDDILDGISRICDPDLKTTFPALVPDHGLRPGALSQDHAMTNSAYQVL